MANTTTFEVGGTRFELGRLKVKDSLRGLKLVGKVLAPALAEAANAPEGQVGGAVAKVVEGLECLPELLDLFTPVTKYVGPTSKVVDLGPFVDDVFGGRPDLCVEFLVRAVMAEYGGFLSRPEIAAFMGRMGAAAAPATGTPVPA